ncbi:SigB/SigF/SigG family RNA polymerase sigma factor [Phaeacidiphilus oryzae]|uniref:SigB/SigF/SigG family RNA polymerase sigma factor n=1 Tax=Phaeacidiphilus oryzae TaxID=348818 RepID=UPI0005603F13|nr:SigB/SigF/SigG family RNA polymerase sigma factor [Phaeacidiphilus oryzae]
MTRTLQRSPSLPATDGDGGVDEETVLPGTGVPHFSQERLRRMGKTEARRLSDQLFGRLKALEPGSPEHEDVRALLIEINLPLVRFAASRYRHRSEAHEDIVQVGTVGLIKAVDAFDPERGVEFPTFALPTISGEMKRFFRDTSWPVRVTRALQERYLSVVRTSDRLEQTLGRPPTPDEVGRQLRISAEEVTEGQEAARVYHARSLDALGEDEDSPGSPIMDRLGSDDGGLAMVEFEESVAPLLDRLPPREQRIVALRFWGNLTQSEIAEQIGISQMHVSRLLMGVLDDLRKELQAS